MWWWIFECNELINLGETEFSEAGDTKIRAFSSMGRAKLLR